MSKSSYIIRFVVSFVSSLSFVYLTWIGAQYVFMNRVVLDVVDGFIAVSIAWYITRDIINIDNKIRLHTQFSKQRG